MFLKMVILFNQNGIKLFQILFKFVFLLIIPSLLIFNYNMNHFFANGGFVLDSAWFASLYTGELTFPLKNPEVIGGTFFSTHFSPFFYFFSVVYFLLNFIGFDISHLLFFSLIQGIWIGIMSSSIYFIIKRLASLPFALNLVLTYTLVFNGMILSMIGFPHIEIALPSLISLFFALLLYNHLKFSLVVLIFLLFVREDVGLHLFGLFTMIYIGAVISKKKIILSSKQLILLAIICLGYSISAIAFQKFLFGIEDNALQRVYLGINTYEHITLKFIYDRLYFIAHNRMYIFIPFIVFSLYAIIKRDLLLGFVLLSYLPWMIFSSLAISFQAGTFTSYYVFPLISFMFMPLILIALLKSHNKYQNGIHYITLSFISALLSVVLFYFSSGNHDDHPWKNFNFSYMNSIETEERVKQFLLSNPQLNFICDDAVGTILIKTLQTKNWAYQLDLDRTTLMTKDTIIFQEGTFLQNKIEDIIKNYNLLYIHNIKNTKFLVASKYKNLNSASLIKIYSNNTLLLDNSILRYYQGFSHKEDAGRWLVGSRIQLPPVQSNSSFNNLCFIAHQFLPNKDSTLSLKIFKNNQPIDFLSFDNLKEINKCLKINNIENYDSIVFEISGYSSPKDNNLSSDDRELSFL